jgi:anti-anti-sigma regulatory factor
MEVRHPHHRATPLSMSAQTSDPLTATPLVAPSVRRLGERTCVINVGTDLRHIELPAVEEAIRSLMPEDCLDIVFDLTFLRRYETFALVRLAREWDRLASSGCEIHVAAREQRVVADLERLVGTVGWQIHPSTAQALRALLSAPIH